MNEARFARLRWRQSGAWMWPVFIVLTFADAVIGHALPPLGDAQSLGSALLVGMVLNLIVVVLLRRPFGALLRRRRRDMPRVVAGDYGGTVAVLGITIMLTAIGLAHRPARMAGQRDMQEATARAQAFIGDRAPATFRRDVQLISTIVVDTHVYRSCVASEDHARFYCVIVKTQEPFGQSVTPAGSEPNSMFSLGVN
jgi:hypothetical protein